MADRQTELIDYLQTKYNEVLLKSATEDHNGKHFNFLCWSRANECFVVYANDECIYEGKL